MLAALEEEPYALPLPELAERTGVPVMSRGLDLAWWYAKTHLNRTQIIERLAEDDARITRSLGETGMWLQPEDLIAIADMVEQIRTRRTDEEAAVLAALEEEPYPLTVAEIAQHSGVLNYAVGRHLVRLTAAGLIRAVDEPERENRWTVCCKHEHTRQVSEVDVELLEGPFR